MKTIALGLLTTFTLVSIGVVAPTTQPMDSIPFDKIANGGAMSALIILFAYLLIRQRPAEREQERIERQESRDSFARGLQSILEDSAKNREAFQREVEKIRAERHDERNRMWEEFMRKEEQLLELSRKLHRPAD